MHDAISDIDAVSGAYKGLEERVNISNCNL